MREHLATLLDDFRKHESEIAIVRYQGVRRREATYGDLARLAGRFAALLEDRGIGKGDRVLLWEENGAEWLAAFFGCLLRGAMVVPLDAFGSADFAHRVAADVKPKLAVGDAVLMAKLSEIRGQRSETRDQGSEIRDQQDPTLRLSATLACRLTGRQTADIGSRTSEKACLRTPGPISDVRCRPSVLE